MTCKRTLLNFFVLSFTGSEQLPQIAPEVRRYIPGSQRQQDCDEQCQLRREERPLLSGHDFARAAEVALRNRDGAGGQQYAAAEDPRVAGDAHSAPEGAGHNRWFGAVLRDTAELRGVPEEEQQDPVRQEAKGRQREEEEQERREEEGREERGEEGGEEDRGEEEGEELMGSRCAGVFVF